MDVLLYCLMCAVFGLRGRSWAESMLGTTCWWSSRCSCLPSPHRWSSGSSRRMGDSHHRSRSRTPSSTTADRWQRSYQ